MFKKILARMGIVLLVIILLIITGKLLPDAIMWYGHWRRLPQEKEYIRVHGQECIKKGMPLYNDYIFSVCGNNEGNIEGFSTIVYDTSDQIGLTADKRSDVWRYKLMQYFKGDLINWGLVQFEARKIDDHFYSVVTGTSWGSDPRSDYIYIKCLFGEEPPKKLLNLNISCNDINLSNE